MLLYNSKMLKANRVFTFLFLLTISFVQSLHVQNINQLHSPGSHHVDWATRTSGQIDHHTGLHLPHTHEDESHGNEHHGFQRHNDLIATRTNNSIHHSYFFAGSFVPSAFELFTSSANKELPGARLPFHSASLFPPTVIRGPPQ
jgi:hypothetical protein